MLNTKIESLSKYNLNLRGSGSKPILFLHGYGCDQNMWRLITPAFEKDHKIILVDLIGSGGSDISCYDYEKYSSLSGYADDIIEICSTLELKNVILVGHSVSAMSALLATIKQPDLFSHLIMIGPSPCYINKENYHGGFDQSEIDGLLEAVESNYLGWSSEITPVIMGNPERPELSEELKESFCRNEPDIARHFAKVTFTGDNRKDLSRSSTKSLIIQVQSDIIAPVQVGEYILSNKPYSELVKLDTSGHCPHLSDPDLTIRAMQSFLN